jgi:arylsulfatase A-like enzyme
MKKSPNIIYLHSHDTGRYIQPYGYAVDTPNLQRLAEEGILFRKAFNAAPTCSPSRACLLTGTAAHSNGMLGLSHLGWRLNNYRQHIIHTLHQAGYASALSGVQHITNPGKAEEIGYDEVLTESYDHKEITQQAIDYLRRDHQRPFFLSVGFFETHRPFPVASEEDDARYLQVPVPLQDNDENRRDMNAFHTSVRTLDQNIGRIMNTLKEQGAEEDTLVICTTDHGLPMPEMKCRLTDHGTGVMLIMRGPEGFRGGKVVDGMVSHLDIFPTVCELLSIEPPEWLQGRSVCPFVKEGTKEIHDEIFAEVNFHAAYEPQRAIRTARWKYIRRFDNDFTKPVLVNCDDSPGKAQRVVAGWPDYELPKEQLYDLLLDPQECVNLASAGACRDVVADLRSRLKRWMEQTADPLLKGPVSFPESCIGWPQTACSTNDPQLKYDN